MKKQRYTPEFKQEAVKMIIIDGVTVKELSKQLGVPEGVLYSWRQKHLDELEANSPEGAQSPKAMAAEIADLRKQLAKQKRMSEILKKTVSYFSEEV
ncbi:transposase [Coraliomargarita sp. SDUM461003]|uniref:Transposase n=1 Tax=Thalassobacterium maritimum TaxID=3041265 RepID=A0ABU1AP05_9BACT|nr:transposase [Coraliomargarita sp. SDUM461003]MDQ8205901.1 transposase [Coraliomargarita sp. SDUM461003]